jgi:Protein of unknown function (DUF3631)
MQPGGDWPERARRVLAAMAGANDDQSTGAMLFADIRDIFSEREADRLPSTELAEALVAIEGRPWAEWRHGKPITDLFIQCRERKWSARKSQVFALTGSSARSVSVEAVRAVCRHWSASRR